MTMPSGLTINDPRHGSSNDSTLLHTQQQRRTCLSIDGWGFVVGIAISNGCIRTSADYTYVRATSSVSVSHNRRRLLMPAPYITTVALSCTRLVYTPCISVTRAWKGKSSDEREGGTVFTLAHTFTKGRKVSRVSRN